MSWLPSFSVEVTRVRPGAALAGAQLDAAAAQLQLMFPQHSRAALAADLARTRSADLTLDNILEGRLPERAGTLRACTTRFSSGSDCADPYRAYLQMTRYRRSSRPRQRSPPSRRRRPCRRWRRRPWSRTPC